MIGNLKAGFHLISTLSWSWSLNHKHTAIGSNEYQSDQIGRKIILPLATQLLTLQWKLSCQSHKWKNVPQRPENWHCDCDSFHSVGSILQLHLFFFFFNWNQLTMTKLNEEYFTVATSANQMPTERYSIIRPVKQIQYWETLSNAVGATSQVNFNLKTR